MSKDYEVHQLAPPTEINRKFFTWQIRGSRIMAGAEVAITFTSFINFSSYVKLVSVQAFGIIVPVASSITTPAPYTVFEMTQTDPLTQPPGATLGGDVSSSTLSVPFPSGSAPLTQLELLLRPNQQYDFNVTVYPAAALLLNDVVQSELRLIFA